MKNGAVVINKAYNQEASTLPTAYWIASNSKPLLPLAIQKLEDDHKLSTKDSIGKYFPEAPKDKAAITIHQLLTHSSDFPQRYVTDNLQSYEEALKALMAEPLDTAAIDHFQYSNDGYALLVLLIEKLTGKTYERYVAEKIFKPAELKHTGFWGFEQNNVSIAPVFDSARAARQPATMYRNGHSVANYGQKGASGIYSTAEDQHLLFKAMVKGRIISTVNLQKAFQPCVFVSENEQLKTYYGYGWFVGYEGDRLVNIRHSGEETWLGHNSMRLFYPNGDAVIVLSNANTTNEGDVWAVQVAYDLAYLLRLQ